MLVLSCLYHLYFSLQFPYFDTIPKRFTATNEKILTWTSIFYNYSSRSTQPWSQGSATIPLHILALYSSCPYRLAWACNLTSITKQRTPLLRRPPDLARQLHPTVLARMKTYLKSMWFATEHACTLCYKYSCNMYVCMCRSAFTWVCIFYFLESVKIHKFFHCVHYHLLLTSCIHHITPTFTYSNTSTLNCHYSFYPLLVNYL